MIRRALPLIAAVLLPLSLAGPAGAEDAVSALKGHDINAPVDVAADRIELQDREFIAAMNPAGGDGFRGGSGHAAFASSTAIVSA